MPMDFEQVQKQQQKLIMTPQMQQAMYLLQMPLLELNTLIQQELVSNPVLEEILDQEKPEKEERQTEKEEPQETEERPEGSSEDSQTENPAEETSQESELSFDDEFAKLSEADDEWRESFQESDSQGNNSDDEENKRRYYESSITIPESLQEHLLKQLRLALQNENDLDIGELLVGNIDNNGYLITSLEEIESLSRIPKNKLEEVLKVIHSLHPVGIGARDLRECLLIQLERSDKAGSLEERIVREHLDELGKKNLAPIAKALDISIEHVQKAAEFITTLEPKPGRIFDKEETVYAVPDIFVEKEGDEYVVTLNNENIPHLRINNLYKKLMSENMIEPKTKEFIKQKITAGQWLIKNIIQRQQTLYSIARELVSRQKEFLDRGLTSLKPLTMQEVAKSLGIHESTVSRAISHKYMETPQGLYQVRYFFSGRFTLDSGETVSTTNLKDEIAGLIKKENPDAPYSDQKIIEILKQKGLDIARRTVAKYRQELNILPSHLRKNF